MKNISWTERFRLNYERYNGQRSKIRSRIIEINKKIESSPSTWLQDMEKLNEKYVDLYRDKVTSGDRLIFTFDKHLLLVDVGPHGIMEDFSSLDNSQKAKILENKSKVPDWMFYEFDKNKSIDISQFEGKSENFDNSEMRWLYEEELNEAWIQFLDKDQANLKQKLFEKLKTHGDFEFHLIMGGAGTGKTVLLVNLALSLATQGRNVVSQFNEQVLKYLNSGKQKVPGSGMKMQPGAVVLLDDPENLSTLQQKLAEAKRNETRALVVALDPFQWTERRVYEKLNELIDISNPVIHELSVCYRQSKSVGKLALDLTNNVLEKTTPFIIESKIADEKKLMNPIKKICVDNISFVDNGGRFRIYESDIDKNFISEFERFIQREDKWTHWHPVLIMFDPTGTQIPESWQNKIKGNNVLVKSLNQIHLVRGAEFQEIYILLTKRIWENIQQGVVGADSYNWARMISIHTIFTRSKDATLVFIK